MADNQAALAELKATVAEEHSAVLSAIVLLNGLTSRLTDVLVQNEGPDLSQAIADIRDAIHADTVNLANAITQNSAAEADSPDFPPQETDEGTAAAPSDGASNGESDSGNAAAGDTTTSSDGAGSAAEAAGVDLSEVPPSVDDESEFSEDDEVAVEPIPEENLGNASDNSESSGADTTASEAASTESGDDSSASDDEQVPTESVPDVNEELPVNPDNGAGPVTSVSGAGADTVTGENPPPTE
jgi:hypothetical protein